MRDLYFDRANPPTRWVSISVGPRFHGIYVVLLKIVNNLGLTIDRANSSQKTAQQNLDRFIFIGDRGHQLCSLHRSASPLQYHLAILRDWGPRDASKVSVSASHSAVILQNVPPSIPRVLSGCLGQIRQTIGVSFRDARPCDIPSSSRR